MTDDRRDSSMPPIKRHATKLRLFYIAVLLVGLLPWAGSVRAEPPQPTATPTRAPFAYGVSFLGPDGQVGTTYRGIPEGTQAPAATDPGTLIAEALARINDARQVAGLSRLLVSQALAEAARDHADDLLSSGAFEHRGSDGRWPADRAAQRGYPAAYLGQNLAAGYAAADELVSAWLADGGSRANLLDPRFTRAGLAFAHNGPWHNYWVLVLAEPPAYRSGQVLVRFQPVAAARVQEVLAQVGAVPLGQVGSLDVQRLAVPLGQEASAVAALQGNPAVAFAEPDRRIGAALEPDDPHYAGKWWWEAIRAAIAWDVTTGSGAVVIAIVDTGVDVDHPDLAAKIVPGYDFVNGDSDPDDDHGHGTHVAGIAAAVTNNGAGVAGTSWGAHIMPLKVLAADGYGYSSDVAEAIAYAVDHGAQIINLSLGDTEPSSTIAAATEYAYEGGALTAAAAGNNGRRILFYPAANDHVVGVAATTDVDTRASFSNYGPHVDVAAPGVGIYSTYPGTYSAKSGTSMATPFVSGLATLVWSVNPALTAAQVQSVIEGSADDLGDPGRDDSFGWGRINAAQATVAALQPASFAISGRISTTHGTSAANVTVTISGTGVLSTTYSDASGIYAQTDLITGTYVVVPSQQGVSFTPISRTVTVGPGDAEDVDFTREDFLVYLPFTAKEYAGPMLLPDDPYFDSQWGLHNVGQVGGTVDADIDAPHAWTYHTGAPGVIVAIVDSGVDMDHPEFNGRLKTGWDYVNDDSDPDDDDGHGTHVAGIAAAMGDNGVGVAGVAWQVQIMPVKVLDEDGGGWYSDMISGINYAVSHGAKVINMSLGGTSPSQAMQDAVNNAYQSGVLVVAAAGNCGDSSYILNGCSYQDQPLYPAAGDNALAVASTTRWDTRSSFSNQGAYVDIAAPGSAIYSTNMGSDYGSMSGTSMATPFVAGLAGLVYSRYPGYSPDQVAQAIVHNADDLGTSGRDDQFGCGRINAHRSLAHGASSSGCAGWSGLSGEGVQGRLALPLDAEFRRGVLLVKFREGVSVDGRARTLGTHGLTAVDLIEELGIYLVAVPEGQELALAVTLSDDPAVAYAEPDYRIYALPLWPRGRTAGQP